MIAAREFQAACTGRAMSWTSAPASYGGAVQDARGLLRPRTFDAVQLFRATAAPELARFVELIWSVAWDLPAGQERTQETLPYPAVHLVVEDGTARIYGVPTERFTRQLSGEGWVLGIKFQPGGFRPLLGSSVSGLRGRVVEASEALPDVPSLVAAVLSASDFAARSEAASAWLLAHLPPTDPAVGEATRAVSLISEVPAMVQVEDLARRLGRSVRGVQRLFTEYVGISPKWVVRRFRMHEAALRAAEGPVDWAALAADLGYYDQPHFVRDFTATVGVPPARYAQECADDVSS
jgi:AraC-like DNA-binding protein